MTEVCDYAGEIKQIAPVVMQTIVYLATNKLNGKRYIGITKNLLKTRRYQHAWAARKGIRTKFAKAIKKYGIDNFEFSVLRIAPTYRDGLDLERKLIEEMKPEYNLAKGGIGPSGVLWSEERRKKIVPALRASWTEERKIKAAEDSRKRVTPERVATFLKYRSPGFKKVVCLNDGLVFGSVGEAQNHYGINAASISSVITGRHAACGNGLSFAVFDKDLTDQDRLALLAVAHKKIEVADAKRKAGMHKRAVICIDTGEMFPSALAADRAFKVARGRVAQICAGLGSLRGGQRFMWADASLPPEINAASEEQLKEAKSKILAALARGVEKNKKRVVCLDNGKIYKSITEAAREHDIHVSALSAGIYRNGRTAGLRFQFMETA